jgi:predicted  nucleic acid-binding Zn-ribbon protein
MSDEPKVRHICAQCGVDMVSCDLGLGCPECGGIAHLFTEEVFYRMLRQSALSIADSAAKRAAEEAVSYVDQMVHAEVTKERERCALLIELEGYHSLAAALRRGEGPRKREPGKSNNHSGR